MTTQIFAPDLVAAVREDIHCHLANGVSLNPYSTDMARWSWQQGFEGKPVTSATHLGPYQRGACAAHLSASQADV